MWLLKNATKVSVSVLVLLLVLVVANAQENETEVFTFPKAGSILSAAADTTITWTVSSPTPFIPPSSVADRAMVRTSRDLPGQ